MKAPDPCERWMLRNPEEIIERLIAGSERAAKRAPREKRARRRESRSHLVAAANSIFRASPKAEVTIKAPDERRKAAMAAAANDPMLKARKTRC